MFALDLCRKNCGKIWHRKPTPSTDNGIMITITNTVTSSVAMPSRNVRFLHSVFDAMGDTFLAGDHQGNIYLFDLVKNRFSLVQRTGHACTALAFNLRRKTEFLVALADYSLKCYDTGTKEMVAWMKGHEAAINNISVHASGKNALTASAHTAQLWNLDSFQRMRKLNIKEDVGIVQVFFLPQSNTIITCFKDNSIFGWETDTLECQFQLPTPSGKSPHYRTLASTKDGRILAAGGRSRFIHLWTLDTRKLLRIIELPEKVTAVKQLEFLPDNFDVGTNQILGILSQDGIVRFVNINTCKLLFDIGTDARINNVNVSANGRYLVAVMEEGNMRVYSLQALCAELNRPPAPLVKVVTENDTISTEKSDRSRDRRRKGKENVEFDTRSSDGDVCELPEGLKMDRLLAILKGYGEYPAKYRMFIWRSYLRLPENHTAYAALVDKGTHPAYSNIHEKYPIKSRRLLRILQRILSALSHWSPIFGETQYLPALAFPFIKLFQNNHLICFEMLATILVNWCQHWFEYFPNPPINVLGSIENVLGYHDRHLLHHFVKYGVTSQIYAWPMLETLFSEVLTKDEWMSVWDNIFSNHPSYMIMVVVAYCVSARGPLMQCTEVDDFKFFFSHRNAIDIKQVIKRAYHLMEATPEDIHPRKTLEDLQPLTRGQYPVFNKFPKFIVDYQIQERERIRQEEMEYLRQKKSSLNMEKETLRRQQEEEAWYRQQQLLMEAENKRRTLIQDEEAKLGAQRKRLQAMNREVKTKELQLLDAARRKFLHFQRQQRESELRRLDDELQRKCVLRDQETEAALEEAEIKNMELHLQKKLFEQELFRDYATSTQQMAAEHDTHRKQEELEERISKRLKDAERERELEVRKKMQQNLARATQQNIDVWAQNEMGYRHRIDDIEREVKNVQLSRLHNCNKELEREVNEMMKSVEVEKKRDTHEAERDLHEQYELAARSDHRRLQLLEDDENIEQPSGRSLDDIAIDTVQSHQEYGDQMFRTMSTESDGPTRVTLDRNRKAFDEKELSLLNEVRRLRQRLATESRTKKPPPTSHETF